MGALFAVRKREGDGVGIRIQGRNVQQRAQLDGVEYLHDTAVHQIAEHDFLVVYGRGKCNVLVSEVNVRLGSVQIDFFALDRHGINAVFEGCRHLVAVDIVEFIPLFRETHRVHDDEVLCGVDDVAIRVPVSDRQKQPVLFGVDDFIADQKRREGNVIQQRGRVFQQRANGDGLVIFRVAKRFVEGIFYVCADRGQNVYEFHVLRRFQHVVGKLCNGLCHQIFFVQGKPESIQRFQKGIERRADVGRDCRQVVETALPACKFTRHRSDFADEVHDR